MTDRERAEAKAEVVAPGSGISGIVRPGELRHLVEEKERREMSEALERTRTLEEQQKQAFRAFTERHLHPEAAKRFSEAVKQAALHNVDKLEILRFSSDWCTDRGRAINNSEPNWPETL